MRKYDLRCIDFLQKQNQPQLVDELPLIIKKSPAEPRDGYIDPYEYNIIKSHWIAADNQPDEQPATLEQQIQAMRDSMGFPNKNLTDTEIHTKYESINVNGNDVGLWRYYPRSLQYEKNLPCFIFLHGGGWVGGTPYTVENPCRLIAEKAGAVVFNIDYSLAPEKKYPHGFNDCYGALEHIYKNAESYGIDKNKIGVGGDSAGGNLTAAMAIKDRDNQTNMIALQVLIYACVAMVDRWEPEYIFDIGKYYMSEEQKDIIDPLISIARPVDDGYVSIMRDDLYFDNAHKQAYEVYASPLMTKSFEGLPTTLSISSEFDGLRIQDELFAKKLHQAGVNVKAIRYNGCIHAFIDRLGFVPQAEDLCLEIANAINNM